MRVVDQKKGRQYFRRALNMDLLARQFSARFCAEASLEPCGGAGLQSVASQIREALRQLTPSMPVLVLQASTGSGKSKFLPSMLTDLGRTDVFTKLRIDVKSSAPRAPRPGATDGRAGDWTPHPPQRFGCDPPPEEGRCAQTASSKPPTDGT